MEVIQIRDLVNAATNEVLGTTDIVNEDLSNLVDVGEQIMNANSVDKYVRALVDHIGKVIFVNRKYSGPVPSVLRDGWEYGAVLEKIATGLPVATENESWELQNGESYDPNIFYQPTAYAKFFNKRTTWEIPMSFAEMQARGSFSNATQMNGFLSMLFTSVENSKTIKTSEMVMRTINNMIGETFYDLNDKGTYTGAGNNRCINLLKLYNDKFKPNPLLTLAQCVTDPSFIRFAGYIMGLYKSRMQRMSTLFNIGGKERFTPKDRLHFVLLAEFAEAANVYLQSDTFHNEFTKLPEAEIVPYWQGSGTEFAIAKTSSIDIKISTEVSGEHPTVKASGILGVMFDRDALGVCNERQRVTTNYNPKAEFFTNWYKVDTGYWNDLNENFVVFYAA